jgi:hypothetical protein
MEISECRGIVGSTPAREVPGSNFDYPDMVFVAFLSHFNKILR